jgi:hypothetical protein
MMMYSAFLCKKSIASIGMLIRQKILAVQLINKHNERFFGLVIALHLQTPKHIRGGWSHYTDTSEPVDGGVL